MTTDAAAAAAAAELEALRRRIPPTSDPDVLELVEGMRATLEELRVAEEELSRQNDELSNLQLAVADEAARYRALFELAPVPYVTTDSYFVIREANDAAAALLAVDRRFVVGKPLAVYIDSDDRRTIRAELTRLSRGAVEPLSVRVRMRRRGGVAFDALLTGSRSAREDVQWVIYDVTEERQAEQRLWELNRDLEVRAAERAEELETVLQQLPVGVMIVDAETRVLRRANRRAREILGDAIVAGAAVTFERFRRFDVDGREIGPEAWPIVRALAGETVSRELVVYVLADGSRPTLEISALPIRGEDGEITGAVMTFDDVTARQRREQAEREFVTNAAHELRTPLTAIASAVEVLQSGAKEVPEERDLFLGHVERECARLARLGTALLSLARAQAGQEVPRSEILPLSDLLGRIAADLPVAGDIDVTVSCLPDVGAVANRELLEQAVWNLAANAVRYTERGEIELSAALEDGHAIVEVRDTGPGIPAEARSRLFERFYRAGARDGEGFGLGLSIALQAVEAVGGTLDVESDAGSGTTARITLTAAKLL
ncbi:MAG TPA: ATP-binding protein [Gaiellaceae bacterium]|nr:ATP-binding protein [Gaiellaceae bacterium]